MNGLAFGQLFSTKLVQRIALFIAKVEFDSALPSIFSHGSQPTIRLVNGNSG